MRIQFGAGQLFLTANLGNYPTDVTPQQLATLQDVDIEIDATIKDLRGQYQFPDDTAISDRKITWKSGTGRFDNSALNQIYFGETALTAGGNPAAVNEGPTPIPTTPFQITVVNAAHFFEDLGVINAATGQRFTRIPTGTPAAGQYTVVVSTGVYTFSTADNVSGISVLISYRYTVTSGTDLIVQQHPQGYGPQLSLFLSLPYQELTAGVPNYCHLYCAKVGKNGQPYKRADYLIMSLEGEAFANAAGQVAEFYED